METLSIISHKGGAGKTSSAVMLAEDLARRGFRVVLIDADRQRGAGLLLGIEQPSGQVQQTENPRLRYLCSSMVPLREIASRAQELAGLFDAAVVDTPSLDDPLARAWIQMSTSVLMVLPVEPISLRTLDGADAALEAVQKLNPKIRLVGILPTMFDETDSTQRTLMLELVSRRQDGLLSPAIPLDSGLAHRAEQKAELRTRPGETTKLAYQATTEYLVSVLRLGGMYQAGTPTAPAAPVAAATHPSDARRAAQPATAQASKAPVDQRPPSRVLRQAPAPEPVAGKGGALRWVLAVAAVLIVIVVSLGLVLRQSRAAGTPSPKGGVLVPAVGGKPAPSLKR
jgi:chromosome partitioning protein